MAPRPKAVTFTQSASNPQPGYDPEPLVIVGSMPGASVAAATTANAGVVKKAASQATFAGADVTALKVELNAWYAKLQAAGIVT